MTRQKLLALIQESRKLVKTATPEQQIKLLKLIRESYMKLKESTPEELPYFLVETEDHQIVDYLEEK